MIFQQILLLICVLLTKQSESSPLLFGNQDIFTGSLNPRPLLSQSSVSDSNKNINYASGGPISVMEKLMPCKKGCFKTPSMKCVCQPVIVIVDYPDSDENAIQSETSTLTTTIALDTEMTKYELHTNSSKISPTIQNSTILNRSGLNLTFVKLQEEVAPTPDSHQLSSSTIRSALLTTKAESEERTTSDGGRLCFSFTSKTVILPAVLSILYL